MQSDIDYMVELLEFLCPTPPKGAKRSRVGLGLSSEGAYDELSMQTGTPSFPSLLAAFRAAPGRLSRLVHLKARWDAGGRDFPWESYFGPLTVEPAAAVPLPTTLDPSDLLSPTIISRLMHDYGYRRATAFDMVLVAADKPEFQSVVRQLHATPEGRVRLSQHTHDWHREGLPVPYYVDHGHWPAAADSSEPGIVNDQEHPQ